MKSKMESLADELESVAQDVQSATEYAAEQSLNRLLCLVASNPETSPGMLNALSRKDSAPILCAVALNPHTDLNTLRSLIHHPRVSVRACTAKHPAAAQFRWRLAIDDNPLVRYELASNDNLPERFLKALLKDKDWRVASRARRTLRQIAAKHCTDSGVVSMAEVKAAADNLLRKTKARALARLNRTA